MRPSALGNMVLHRLGAPGIHWRHFLPRHPNVHVVLTLLSRRRRRSRFGSRNHRFSGGLVPTSPSRRGGRRRGRPGNFSPGMLRRTACGLLLLLLLLGGLAMALGMNAFPRRAMLALRAVPLLVTLLATAKHSSFSYRRFRSAFTTAVLALWLESCLSAALPCSLVPASATDLASRRVAVCRRAASLASITAWSRRCWSIMLNRCARVMQYEMEPSSFPPYGETRVALFPLL